MYFYMLMAYSFVSSQSLCRNRSKKLKSHIYTKITITGYYYAETSYFPYVFENSTPIKYNDKINSMHIRLY